ncbi:MAG: hypothetical protein QW303_00170 [Nitrososphaerota archaeon]
MTKARTRLTGFLPSDLTSDYDYETICINEIVRILKIIGFEYELTDYDKREGIQAILNRIGLNVPVITLNKTFTINELVRAQLLKNRILKIPQAKKNGIILFCVKNWSKVCVAIKLDDYLVLQKKKLSSTLYKHILTCINGSLYIVGGAKEFFTSLLSENTDDR